MFSANFLRRVSSTYGLTQEQEEVFLRRILQNKSHQEISSELEINVSACLRRMAEVYKKFEIGGKGRGKNGALRKFLVEQQSRFEATTDKKLVERVDGLANRLSTLEEETSRELINLGAKSPVLHNLPAQTNKFIGRKKDLNRLLQYLSEDHAYPLITVDGIGGIGKTALVLEAAYRCLGNRDENESVDIPKFDAIIFVSAKERNLLPSGIVSRMETHRTLGDICQEISLTLDEPSIIQEAGTRRFECVKQVFRKKKTLLIVDNYETLDDEEKDKVVAFLKSLPGTVKSVITTRERRVIHADIRLDSMPEDDSLALINQQTEERNLTLTNNEAKVLHQASGGIPLVIMYAIGLLSYSFDSNVEILLQELRSEDGDLAQFLFQKEIDEIREKPAYYALISIAIFRKSPFLDSLIEVAGLSGKSKSLIRLALEQLQQLSLIRQKDGRCMVLPPTREYALAELNTNKLFEEEARERWLNWYTTFAQKYGGDDWGEWHKQYDRIDREWKNFLEVLDWCAGRNRYEDVKNIWRCLNKCASLYGYWDDRLYWLNWLIEESQRHANWENFVEATTAKAWTLILKESPQNLEEADKLQKEAWKLREHANLSAQYVLAENIAVLRIRQGRYEEAYHWFETYKKLTNKANLNDLQQCRSEIRYLYYSAEVKYRQKQYDLAKRQYQKALKQAEDINWLRFEVNIQSWLATIAVKQREFDKAERLLKKCIRVAEGNKDRRRVACCKYSYARLEMERGNVLRAKKLAQEALDSFEKLGVERDSSEIRTFLSKC
ncbi:MAG: NB-ARC domain-containing protein [Cyanobacteria bacterium P01_G01_bin.38]